MEDEILQEFLAESWENLARLDSEIVTLEKQPDDAELLASIFRTIHTIKGTCGFIGLTELGALAHSAENVLGQMRNGVLKATPAAISLVLAAVDRIKEILHGLEATGKEPHFDNAPLITKLDALAETAASGTSPATPQPAPAPEPASPVAMEAAVPAAPATAEELPAGEASAAESVALDESRKGVADLSIRVSVDVLDRLMNLVGELVLTRNQLLQMSRGDEESRYSAPIAHLNRVTTDLQEGVMKTRMQPIGNAWSKLPRLVRDLSTVTGKQIELEMSGAETELDRTVLDAIKDPLTHMVRNSADHGIESAADRRQKGKSEIGKIRLNAHHEGGHVVICIEDDGGGINTEKVRRKAIQNGLVSEADAARLSDNDILQFIFLPGLSTADKISSVSGRGVGMDVVKTQIEKIGGTVEIMSSAGSGTSVRIKIPLTLAIISALVVEAGEECFAIPQLGVVELVRLPVEDRHRIERIHNHQVFRLRDRLLPLVYLDEALGLSSGEEATETDVNIVVVQVGEQQFGLIVDEVFDTEEIVVKPVGSLLKDVNIYQGTTILGDGRVIMILDVGGIASQFGGVASNAADLDHSEHDADAEGTLTSLLVFEREDGSSMSVPLSLVARLEEIPRERIEKTGDRLVVQYRGDLLPLLPINGDVSAQAGPDPQPVIVFSEDRSSMGLMVSRIQDILEERLSIRMQSQRPGVMGTAIIGGKATDVIDTQFYVMQANPEWFTRGDSQVVQTILLVDDSTFFLQLARTTLETGGHRVITAQSAERAIELIEHGKQFDLIVSDLDLPNRNGHDLARWLRGRADTSRTPLVALTGISGQSQEKQSLQSGFDRFLVKFDPQQLLATINDLCPSRGFTMGVPA